MRFAAKRSMRVVTISPLVPSGRLSAFTPFLSSAALIAWKRVVLLAALDALHAVRVLWLVRATSRSLLNLLRA